MVGIGRLGGAVRITAAVFVCLAAWGSGPAKADSCIPYIIRAEGALGIPPGLLMAIALTESGRRSEPYPWSLNIGGESHFARDMDEMQELILANGGGDHPNIDVGCMQISLRYHKSVLPDYTLIYLPEYNVLYGAYYLRKLFDQYGDWVQAIAHYHSGDPVRQFAYVCRVIEKLKAVRRSDGGAPDACASG
jgi:soluble lytic murein transglycosylase-like protein